MDSFDFGLTASQKERAEALHKESIVIDMLFQGPIGTYSLPEDLEDELLTLAREAHPYNEIAAVSYASDLIHKWFSEGKGRLEALYKDCWYESGITAGNRQISAGAYEDILPSLISIQTEFDNKPWLIKAKKAEDIEYAHKNGLKAGIVTTQETLGFGKDLGLIEKLYAYGLRVVQLTYNNHNYIGAGCMERNDAGISNFGAKFVDTLNNLGIVVDTGHCGRQTTLDACKLSKAPVIASHTGAEAVYFHNRCKSDEEIKAIADTGGVVGIFTMPWFIAENPEDTTLNHLLDHIDHVVRLTGVDHVGIGTDWPMPQTKWMAIAFKKLVAHTMGFKKGDGPSTEYVKGLKDYRSFGNITQGLMSRGYSEKDIAAIIGENWLRVFKQVWK